jgi:hypothetical protein
MYGKRGKTMNVPTWVTELGVAGTWVVAAIALFGAKFWAWLHRPKLQLRLVHDGGEPELDKVPSSGVGLVGEESREARYYRLRCENLCRSGPAHEVQIVIEKLERAGPNGTPVLVYRGPLPLEWQHAKAFPALRTVGGSVVAELLSVRSDRTLRLLTAVVPNLYAEAYAGRTDLWITVAARALERDGPSIRLKVSWDGEWHVGEAEMRTHLSVEPV